jgi:hypothetical protein
MSKLTTDYARSIGVTEADAHTARNIHLSVADCKHLRKVLGTAPRWELGTARDGLDAYAWNQELSEYLKGAV